MSSPHMGRKLTSLGIAAAALAGVSAAGVSSPGDAAAQRTEPIEIAKQAGIVREVLRGSRWTVWTRCLRSAGPTDVWATRSASSPNRRVRGLKRSGPCAPHDLIGMVGNRLVLELGRPGARRVLAVDVRNGRQQEIVAETPGPDGREIVDVDVSGRRIAWIQIVGPPETRTAQVVRGTVGRPQTRVMHEQPLFGGAVELVGVWVNPRGEVAYREVLRGALYGYSAREERVERIDRLGGRSELASPAAGTQLVAADLGNTRFSYTIARDDTRRVFVFTRDLDTGKKRRLRAVLAAPPRLERTPPALPAPQVNGNLTLWRERVPIKRSFNDTIRFARGLALVRRPIERRRDVRQQRWFVAPPSIDRRIAVWAEVRFQGAGGWTGGYQGLPPGRRTGRSTVYAMPVRPR